MTDLDNKIIDAIVKALKKEFKGKEPEETVAMFNKIRQHFSFIYLGAIADKLNSEE